MPVKTVKEDTNLRPSVFINRYRLGHRWVSLKFILPNESNRGLMYSRFSLHIYLTLWINVY